MALSRSEIIQANPIGDRLEAFRTSFLSTHPGWSPNAFVSDTKGKSKKQLTLHDILLTCIELSIVVFDLLLSLQGYPAIRLLPPTKYRPNLLADVLSIAAALNSNAYDLDRIKPLLHAVLTNKPDDEIWNQVYHAVTE